MDQENKLPSEIPMPEETNEKNVPEMADTNAVPLSLPDDALAEIDVEKIETKPEALFPSSLDDEDDFIEEDDDGLFTDEELAALIKKEKSDYAISSKVAESDISGEDVPDVFVEKDVKKKVTMSERVRNAFDIVEMFVLAMAFVLLAMAFCFRHSVVDGGSMDNTLQDGEHLIISDLFYTPKQGDIVVVQDLSKEKYHPELSHPIVKRVIATEGQTVMILPSGQVYIDGDLLVEDYVYIDEPYYRYDELYLTVPEGCVFLMGDHRNVSLDSRSSAGAFSEDAILGKVILRFAPLDRFGLVE